MTHNILVLTPIYPAPDIHTTATPVVHYFTREWVKFGYDIRVVHYDTNFPRILQLAIKPFVSLLSSKAGFGIRTNHLKDLQYTHEGVKVNRICLCKTIPHTPFTKKEIQKALAKTISYCDANNFVPDAIIGHWPNPQLEIMCALKRKFGCKTCFVSHGDSITKFYNETTKMLLDDIDIVGFRCNKVKDRFFSDDYPYEKPYFMCYSGIPESFLDNRIIKDFSCIRDFIYVGTLIKRKFPSVIVDALARAYGKENFCMKYVGAGADAETIKESIERNGVGEKVQLLGHIDRDEVQHLIDKSQVFVMISKNEAYGLVYLEAMARGCITIASRGEGFDGVIKHGVNGFLCEAGNTEELANIISGIRKMSESDLQRISENAKLTADDLTDVKAARYYIKMVESILG